MKLRARFSSTQDRYRHYCSYRTRLRALHEKRILATPAFLFRLETGRRMMYRRFAHPWHVVGISLGIVGVLSLISSNPYEILPCDLPEAVMELEEVTSLLGILALLGAAGSLFLFFNRCEELDVWFTKTWEDSLGSLPQDPLP